MLRVGPFELHSIVTGTFRLDGGAMFGILPKVLWSRSTPSDDQNRIPLATRTLLAVNRPANRVILVDTGCGTKWLPEAAARYAIVHDATAIDRALKLAGLAGDDVTDVVVTHLHFDHNGGLTDWANMPGGPTQVRYPRARHWIHRRHWEHAQRPHLKDRASFLRSDFEALADGGLLCFVDGEEPASPMDGLSWHLSHGHTPYQLHPVFEGERSEVIFVGDMVPTAAHVPVPWVMAYDLRPMTTMDEKQRLVARCLDRGTKIAMPHDPIMGIMSVGGSVERPEVLAGFETTVVAQP